MRFRSLVSAASVLTLALSIASVTHADDHDFLSGTYLDPALQRQDIFSHNIWRSYPEYRQVYNRPRFFSGFVANTIEPSSQEAMAWKINQRNGNYANHRGPYVPEYNYPKPWEVINTVARPK